MDEIVKCIRVPKKKCIGNSAFSKLGAREYMVISIVMTAARLRSANKTASAKALSL